MVSAIGKGRQGVEHVSGSSWEKNTKAECWRGPRKQCLKKKKKKKPNQNVVVDPQRNS